MNKNRADQFSTTNVLFVFVVIKYFLPKASPKKKKKLEERGTWMVFTSNLFNIWGCDDS